MTIEWPRIGEGIGLSTDTKPTKPSGYRIFETDTGDTLISDGTYWWLQGYPSTTSQRRIGILSYGPSLTNGQIGLFTLLTNATGVGTGSNAITFTDVTNGRFYNCISGTTTGNRGGVRHPSIIAIRGNNAKLFFRFKLVTTTLQNFWLGFIGGAPTELAGADPFAGANPGVVFGMNTGVATNWSVMYNDSTGSTNVDNTTIPFDTNIHTLKLVADEANTKFMWSLDGGAYQALTTPAQIPSQTNALGIIAEIETQESTVAKSFQLYQMSIQTEK